MLTMEKIEAWKDSNGAIHETEAEARAAETYLALLPFTKNYEGGQPWSPVAAAAILSNNAQELFDILAGLGYRESGQTQDPLPFAETMGEPKHAPAEDTQ
jgi:hypothetical protein